MGDGANNIREKIENDEMTEREIYLTMTDSPKSMLVSHDSLPSESRD
jgi:hypothetical protein